MTLEEIFSTNPDLLKEKEVVKLIEYVKEQHIRTWGICKKYNDFHDKVMELCMYSNIVLKNGKSERETLELIFDLLE